MWKFSSGNVKLAMSHVVPDLVQKVRQGTGPAAHPRKTDSRSATTRTRGDLAKGIVTAMESPAALNDDFNLSTSESTTVLALAEKIWRRIKGDAFRSAT